MDRKIKLLISIWGLIITADCVLSQPDSLWSRRYQLTLAKSILTLDGNYAFTGYNGQNPDTIYAFVAELDTEGETIWENIWIQDHTYSHIVQTPDSGIAIVGRRNGSYIIRKFNSDGEPEYSWRLGYDGRPKLNGFLSDGEGGYIVAGHDDINNGAELDFILLKVSAEGEEEWLRVYEEGGDQECRAMIGMPDSGFMLVGNTRVRNFGNEVNVIRTDEDGEIIWRNHYGTELIDIPAGEGGYDIIATEDGNYIIVGETLANGDRNEVDFDVLIIKIDIDGEVIWMNTIDLERDEKGRSIAKTMDGGFVISGYSTEGVGNGNPFIMKTDDSGNLIWSDVIAETESDGGIYNHYNALAHQDRTFSLVCRVQNFPSGYIQKYGRDPHGVADGNNVFLPTWTGLDSAYPNPFNSITTFVFTVGSPAAVEIDIFNAIGRRQAELVRRSYPIGQHRLSWDARGLPSGDYFACMTAGEVVSTKKVALIK